MGGGATAVPAWRGGKRKSKGKGKGKGKGYRKHKVAVQSSSGGATPTSSHDGAATFRKRPRVDELPLSPDGSEGGAKLPTKRQRDRVLCLNRAIAGCAQRKQSTKAKQIYEQILSEGLTPTAPTFGALVNAAVRVGDLGQARAWMDESKHLGIEPGVVVYTTLLKGFCESDQLNEATQFVFGPMAAAGCAPNLRTANTLLRGCKRAGEVSLAASLFKKMTAAAPEGVSSTASTRDASAANGWGLTPDATSYEYLIATLCQGLKTVNVRRLLKQLGKSMTASPVPPMLLARLWEFVAEASLLRSEPTSRTLAALRRAARLHRATKPGQVDGGTLGEGHGPGAMASSAALFAEFKEQELEERKSLVVDYVAGIKSGCKNREDEPSRKDETGIGRSMATWPLLLPRLAQLIVLPPTAGSVDGNSDQDNPLSTDALVADLQRSYGLVSLLRKVPAQAKRSECRNEIAARLDSSLQLNGNKQHLALANLFEDPALPLKLEICSGDGHWICTQAVADRGQANWACMELRRDRVFRTVARASLLSAPGFCAIAGDAVQGLRRLKAGSVSRIFVNFPEPPSRRGRGESVVAHSDATRGGQQQHHLLTASTLRLICRALVPNGTLLVLSDNGAYLRQLATLVDAASDFANCDPGGSAVRDDADGDNVNCDNQDGERRRPKSGTFVWRGRPSAESCGAPDPAASSYFDRLWKRGRFVKRHFLLVQRASTHLEDG